jgi:catechol 2,3-dioxygenase
MPPEDRMRLLRIGHVVLAVRDLERAARFYVEALGFNEVNRLDRPRAVFLTLGEQHHDLALFELPSGSGESENCRAGLHHIAFQVSNSDELKEYYARLKRHGVHISRTADHGVTNSIYFSDPDGNGLEAYCDIGVDGLARARRRSARSADDFPPLEFDAQGR